MVRRALVWYVHNGPSSYFAGWEGIYVALRLGFALLWVWMAARGCYLSAIVLASLTAFDILAFNTAAVFITQGLGDILRSAALTMIAYVSLAITFAPAWMWFGSRDGGEWERIVSGLYQSVRTLTTAGPESVQYSGEKLLASSEMFVGIYFLSIIVAGYLSWLNGGH